MQLTVINVGYGDALLLEDKGGYAALIDGGSALPGEFAGYPYRIPAAEYLKKRGVRRLNDLFISHIHEDHVCGLMSIVESCGVERLYVPYPVAPFLEGVPLQPLDTAPRSVWLYAAALNDYMAILRHADSQGIAIRTLTPGDVVDMSDGARAYTLAPKPANIVPYMETLQKAWASDSEQERTALLTKLDRLSNSTSMVLKVEAGGMVFLDAADCTPQHWNEMPFSWLKNVNVLKLPHHGQIDCLDVRRMGAMPLQYVITTASSDRRYNSANPDVYRQLETMFSRKEPALRFLFSDERSFLPWFSRPEGFQAITLEMDSGAINPEFVEISEKEMLP